MANKIAYNNINYDILDAITLSGRDYLVLIDLENIRNITFLESTLVNGERKYFLPPKDFRIANNPNCDLKRLQSNFVLTNIIEILKEGINSGFLKSQDDIKNKFQEIRSFIQTDLNISDILSKNTDITFDDFLQSSKYLETYLGKRFNYNEQAISQDYSNYLDRPIRTSEGLDYEWLYNLSLEQLKELAGSNRTSEELIYILDALDKKQKSEDGINHYNEMGHSMVLTKNDKKAAFIDILLIILITASFSLLLFLGIF